MGLFAGVGSASYNEGGIFVQPGNYLVEVGEAKTGKTRKGRDFFVVQLKVLESDSPERPKGVTMSWMLMFDLDATMGNIKHFISVCEAVASKSPINLNAVDEASCEMVVSAEQPYEGEILALEAVNVKTQAGGVFTKCKFSVPVSKKN